MPRLCQLGITGYAGNEWIIVLEGKAEVTFDNNEIVTLEFENIIDRNKIRTVKWGICK